MPTAEAIKFYEGLTLTGPWGTAYANAVSLRTGFAPQYNTLSLVIIDCPVSPAYLDSQAVTVTLTAGGVTNTLFLGRVRAARWLADPADQAVYAELDGEESTADVDLVASPRVSNWIGWNVVFNEGGRPNCNPASAGFNFGPSAGFWTAALAIEYIRDTYMLRSTWTITDQQLAACTAITRVLPPYDARGVRCLQAVADIAAKVGARLAFRYSSGAIVPAFIDAAGAGTFTVAYRPGALANAAADPQAPAAGPLADNEARSVEVAYDSRQQTPVMYAVSGRFLHECTYSTLGASPLLAGAPSKDAEFAWDYQIQTANYAGHYVASSMPAGSAPLKILRQLATRRSAAGTYHTPAEVTANPTIGEAVDLQETLAVYTGGTWKRIMGGAKLDLDGPDGGIVLRLKKELQVATGTAGKTAKLNVSASMPDVRFTGATEILLTGYATANTYATGIAVPADGVVNCERVIPSRRFNSTLPDTTPNTWVVAEAAAVANYRDPSAELLDALAGVYAQRARRPSTVKVTLPYITQEIPVGALLAIDPIPANTTVSGREIVSAVNWDLREVTVTVDASDSLDFGAEATFISGGRIARAAVRKARRKSR